MKFILQLIFCLSFLASIPCFGQTYYNETGKRILQGDYEEKILNGPYFGVPGDEEGVMKLVHRMPAGLVDAKFIYQKLGLEDAYSAGRPLIVLYYPGKDECNSTGLGNTPESLRKKVKAISRYAEKHDAVAPLYFYKNPHGLEKYQGIQQWTADPDGLFENQFFPFHYPCGSFVVISPKGKFRAILGEYPISQIDVALKKL
ncbi:hypothetical protein SAMN03080617_00548 [Algoriphagus alkaliphilus]|uniref:Uncharacterized protein n=1 Tax=Algoriphagus alkaliphilus TaxID=279824 RepID=A0A1G5VLG2_9BACT|nr:hypothetical protein [Algoriphagus alkaliphilus]SDA46712.1 hypothetical protein SAMN03080617_00548 [Algoriphagus alkaliphilus]